MVASHYSVPLMSEGKVEFNPLNFFNFLNTLYFSNKVNSEMNLDYKKKFSKNPSKILSYKDKILN